MSFAAPHLERHFTGSETLRNIVIGMSDGLTVPFALAAGLTGAIDSSRIVVTAGLAEVAAGSIAMGLGGYLAARGDAEHYLSELVREQREVVEKPEAERGEVAEILGRFGLTEADARPVVEALTRKPERWVSFMMRYELGLEEPNPRAALTGALTIAGAYVVGGLVPLSPYFVAASAHAALGYSVGFTAVALLIFGYVKGRFAGARPLRGALQTVLIGGTAAAAAFVLARLLG